MEDEHSQQRHALLNMTVDELYSSLQRRRRRPGRWTMPGRLVVPEFRVRATRSGYFGRTVVELACDRCTGEFTVYLPEFVKIMAEYQTRPCPYCFKVGKVPDEIWRMTHEG